MDKDRLIEIETKLAYQEKTLKELNDVVFQQDLVITKLEKRYEKLAGLLDDHVKNSSGAGGPANEKPPHY